MSAPSPVEALYSALWGRGVHASWTMCEAILAALDAKGLEIVPKSPRSGE